jgi:mannose/fructose-specific phosphotransferase system component IIA
MRRANAPTITHSEAAAELLNAADAVVGEQLRRNNGDSSANALYSALLDLTLENTGERLLLIKGWKALAQTVQQAGKGEFDPTFDAAAYASQVLSDFTSEQHRKEHLLAKIESYTNPAGKMIFTYTRDKNAGQLVEYAVPALLPPQQVQLEASKARALQSLQQQVANMEDMRVIAGNQAVPMPVRPAFVRPTPAILNQMDAQCLQAQASARQSIQCSWQHTCADEPADGRRQSGLSSYCSTAATSRVIH